MDVKLTIVFWATWYIILCIVLINKWSFHFARVGYRWVRRKKLILMRIKKSSPQKKYFTICKNGYNQSSGFYEIKHNKNYMVIIRKTKHTTYFSFSITLLIKSVPNLLLYFTNDFLVETEKREIYFFHLLFFLQGYSRNA